MNAERLGTDSLMYAGLTVPSGIHSIKAWGPTDSGHPSQIINARKQGEAVRILKGALATGGLSFLLAACGSASPGAGSSSGGSATAPKQIVIGTTYAGSGAFASSSMPEYEGLKFWIKQENAQGGVMVKAFGKRIPIKLVSYNDQSSPATASNYYTQLITQDHVNIFVSDFGSVLTAPAVSIAQEHQMLLFDQTATASKFFTKTNPYIVLLDLRASAIWPKALVGFLGSKNVKRVAIVYNANDFDLTQQQTIVAGLKKMGITPVFNQALAPLGTTDYSTLLNSIAAKNPQAVIELGYPGNDTAFLKGIKAGGFHFPLTFTVFPAQLPRVFQGAVGTSGLAYTYTYGYAPIIAYNNVTLGMTAAQFTKAFSPSDPSATNFLNVAGYNTGLAIQAALANAPEFTQLSMRAALEAQSGKLKTVNGTFQLDSTGAQVGEYLPVAQYIPGANGAAGTYKIVYPASQANGTAVYPAP